MTGTYLIVLWVTGQSPSSLSLDDIRISTLGSSLTFLLQNVHMSNNYLEFKFKIKILQFLQPILKLQPQNNPSRDTLSAKGNKEKRGTESIGNIGTQFWQKRMWFSSLRVGSGNPGTRIDERANLLLFLTEAILKWDSMVKYGATPKDRKHRIALALSSQTHQTIIRYLIMMMANWYFFSFP